MGHCHFHIPSNMSLTSHHIMMLYSLKIMTLKEIYMVSDQKVQ